jgi:hypothetical protein
LHKGTIHNKNKKYKEERIFSRQAEEVYAKFAIFHVCWLLKTKRLKQKGAADNAPFGLIIERVRSLASEDRLTALMEIYCPSA